MVGRIEIELDTGAPYDDGPGAGSDAGSRRSRRRVRYGPVAAALVLFAGAAVWHERSGNGRDAAVTTTTAAATTSSSAAPGVTVAGGRLERTGAAPTPPPAATEHLVVRRTDGGFAEVDAATGTSTELAVPPIRSTGFVHFVAGDGWTAVRPMDVVPGYLLDAAGTPTPLAGGLDTGTFTFLPGPYERTVWIDSGDTGISLTLYGLDGTPVAAPFRMPTSRDVLGPDGTGQVAVQGPGGVYVTSNDGWQRLTTGRLVAVGPATVVAEECDEHLSCVDAVVDRHTGEWRALYDPARRSLGDGGLGTVSPDGRWAALNNGHGTRVDVVDLANGTSTTVGITEDRRVPAVWSADSRRVWFLDGGGGVDWYEPGSGAAGQLVIGPVDSFVLRAAAPIAGAPS